jgi:hypothetical protein
MAAAVFLFMSPGRQMNDSWRTSDQYSAHHRSFTRPTMSAQPIFDAFAVFRFTSRAWRAHRLAYFLAQVLAYFVPMECSCVIQCSERQTTTNTAVYPVMRKFTIRTRIRVQRLFSSSDES